MEKEEKHQEDREHPQSQRAGPPNDHQLQHQQLFMIGYLEDIFLP